MKTMTEYTAEVFRRSEKRIAARRKKRRAVLAVCVPLCLCAAVLAAALPPHTREGVDGIVTGTVTATVVAVETERGMLTDKATVTAVCDMVYRYNTVADTPPKVENYDAGTAKAHTFSLLTDDGGKITYTLSGNVLQTGGWQTSLSDTDAAALYTLLGGDKK